MSDGTSSEDAQRRFQSLPLLLRCGRWDQNKPNLTAQTYVSFMSLHVTQAMPGKACLRSLNDVLFGVHSNSLVGCKTGSQDQGV